MTFIWWIYHFWARFWPYFNFVDFRAFFGPFSLVNRDRQKMADLLRKMASNQKMQENKPTLKFNFTIEKRWPVSIFELFGPQHLSHWALLVVSLCFLGFTWSEDSLRQEKGGDSKARCHRPGRTSWTGPWLRGFVVFRSCRNEGSDTS